MGGFTRAGLLFCCPSIEVQGQISTSHPAWGHTIPVPSLMKSLEPTQTVLHIKLSDCWVPAQETYKRILSWNLFGGLCSLNESFPVCPCSAISSTPFQSTFSPPRPDCVIFFFAQACASRTMAPRWVSTVWTMDSCGLTS